MYDHGWGKTAAASSGTNDRAIQKEPAILELVHEQSNTTSSSTTSGNDVRSELLNQIKRKIKAGFYNRESVLDDIGYGFAQALDHSL